MQTQALQAGNITKVAAFLVVGLALSATFNPPRAAANYDDGGYGYSGSTRSSTPATDGGETVEVTLDEWGLGFNRVSVKAGTVNFRIVNAGAYEHVFEIEGKGVEKKTGLLASGNSTTLSVTLKPGQYAVYCPVPGHEPRGMKGKVVVQG